MKKIHPHTTKTKKRSLIFFEIGLITSLSLTLWAFNISNRTADVKDLAYSSSTIDDTPEFIGEIDIVTDEELVQKKETRPTDKFQVVPDPTPIPDPDPDPDPVVNPDPIGSDIGTVHVNPNRVPDDEDLMKEYIVVQQMPSFPGGVEAMMNYINANVEYPDLARENNISGRVVVTFIVEKDGSLSNIKIAKSAGWGLDEEAIRVVQSMPNWVPGENNFRKVRVRIALPIRFVLS
ncbi:MAG: energy transducer TonB [Bacteroidota bacterium]|nr:energy transducer TonB [Bacteroidota bacterium]MDX5430104.1 energy transducer TonB [Bacteroidota bacterium]MDX5468868.1 energy transducer TonB [Bacteroidota bacterium]